jgi:hypothetical protein
MILTVNNSSLTQIIKSNKIKPHTDFINRKKHMTFLSKIKQEIRELEELLETQQKNNAEIKHRLQQLKLQEFEEDMREDTSENSSSKPQVLHG